MRHLLFLTIACLSFYSLSAQYNWSLAKTIDGHADNAKIATDNQGNVFVYGDFSDVLTAGSFQLGLPWIHACFIAKMDPSGNFVWLKQINGSSVTASSIAIDAHSNVILAGYTSGYVSLGTDTIKNEGFFDAFIAKLDSNGNYRWLNGIQGQDVEAPGFQIVTDSVDNIYIPCEVSNESRYKTDTVKSCGHGDAAIYKIDSAGNLLWRKILGGSKLDGASGITMDKWGNLYVVGTFQDTLFADDDVLITNDHISTFLTKYNANGELIWIKEQAKAIGTAIVSDVIGNIFLIGSFADTAEFGPSVLMPVVGKDSRFLAKYDSSGQALWSVDAGVGLYQTGKFNVDNSGNVYLPSAFNKAVTKIDGNGNVLWKKYPSNIKETNDLCLDASNNIYVTGNFSGQSYFAPFTLNGLGVFIARLSDATGVQEITSGSLHIYPNPASSTISFTSTYAVNDLRLLDITGRIVYKEQLSGKYQHTVSLATVPDGLYFVELSDGKNVVTNKVLVNH